MNKYPTLYVIQKWISGGRGLEPRLKTPVPPCFPFVYFPTCPQLSVG